MTRQLLIQFPTDKGKQSLFGENPTETTAKVVKTTMDGGRVEKYRKTQRLGEVAGGTAAECAAVCCCCPCTLMHLLILTIFKMPVCLCKKAQRRHRIRKKKKKALLGPGAGNESEIEKLEREVRAAVEKQKAGGYRGHDHYGQIEAVDLDKEVWDQFFGTGFWRSPSQRSTV